MDSTTILSI